MTVPGWSCARVHPSRPIVQANGNTYAMASRYLKRPSAPTAFPVHPEKEPETEHAPDDPAERAEVLPKLEENHRVLQDLPRVIGEDGVQMGDDEAGEDHVYEEMIADRGVEPDLAAPGDRHHPTDDHRKCDERPVGVERDSPEKVNLRLGKIWDHPRN